MGYIGRAISYGSNFYNPNTWFSGIRFLLTLYLWYARPALRRGLSIRPPPAITPTVARHRESRTFLAPDGSLMRVLPVSVLCEMITAELPDALARTPRSPT